MKRILIDKQGWIAAKGYRKNVLVTGEELHRVGALIQLVSIDAGQAILDHYHQHTFEVYFVVAGRCRLEVNGESILMHSGTLLLMEPGDVHSLRNDGSERFDLLVFKTNAVAGDLIWGEKA